MKLSKYLLLLALACGMPSCMDLDIPPMNVVQDKDIFGSESGIKAYLARVYGQVPMEDFRYSPERGLNNFWIIEPSPYYTGEAVSSLGAKTENTKYWGDAYRQIRDVNYFLETLPQYEANFSKEQLDTWKGEMLFARAFTYFALAKRYGGVPLVNEVLKYPDQPVDELKIPRSSEEATYDAIKKDLDDAYSLLPETNQVGRATRYVAAALKSRAMLFAGSIAKYNTITNFDDKNVRLCGIPAEKAADYFKEAYDAAKLLEGHFELYKGAWKDGDKEAQYQNYVDLFFAEGSKENIFVREYQYPNSVHGYDCYCIPRQYMVGGYSSYVNPTLDFVEMFEGFPKDTEGKTLTVGTNGKYVLYDNLTDFFKNAEPRLRATVILPGDEFKGDTLDVRRGIYKGDTNGGIAPLLKQGAIEKYEASEAKDRIVTSSSATQDAYTLADGTKMTPAGRSGRFANDGTCARSGFSVRKWMNPDMEAALVLENHSDQTWIEIRYAEVLLNRAEAAMELAEAGKGADYKDDAMQCINDIRERAGATLVKNVGDMAIDTVRIERRKELSFENKTWWDLKRWRILDKEQNNRIYRVLMPFFVDKEYKWFFDARYDEDAAKFTFDTKWYYVDIPSDEIVKNGIKQNPGY